MLGKRAPQGDLFRADTMYMQHVGEDSFHGILGRMGASWFRDEDFEGLYGESQGRPSNCSASQTPRRAAEKSQFRGRVVPAFRVLPDS